MDEFERHPTNTTALDARAAYDAQLGLRDVLGFLRRNWMVIILGAVMCTALGVFYTRSVEPTFTAVARVVIDPEQARIASQNFVSGAIIIETGEVESQIEIVKSEAIAMMVIHELNLTDDPELQLDRSWSATAARLLSFVGIDLEQPDADAPELAMRRTVAGFFDRLRVWRVGQSYVMEIAYTSSDPAKAARIANATAHHYIQAGLEAKSQAAKSGAKWLEGRLAEVSRQANQAARAVEEFRSANNISQAGETSLDQQQLAETSSQLSAAKADTAAQRARLVTIERLLSSGDLTHGYVDEALTSLQITTLRENLIAATARLDELRGRYGPDGMAVVAVKAEIDGLKDEIRQELLRIGQVYKANLETAERREELLAGQLVTVLESGSNKNKARVDLVELESRAHTYRQMYQTVLQQLMTALQQASFPVGEARMVATAATPLTPTWPKMSLILAMSLAVGSMVGLGYAGLREALDRRIRTPVRLRQHLDVPSLGVVPRVRFDRKYVPSDADDPQEKIRARLRHRLNFALQHPHEPFSQSLRDVMASIDLMFRAGEPKIIGVTSAIAGEGKTTVASNLAQLYASAGSRTILIDACCVNSTLSDVLILPEEREDSPTAPQRPAASQGKQMGQQPQARRQLVAARKRRPRRNSVNGLSIIGPPLLLGVDDVAFMMEGSYRNLNFPALRAHLEHLRPRHDVVILDLPDLEGSADARMVSAFADAMVFVVGNQRKVTLDRLAAAIAGCGGAQSRFGVLLNKMSRRASRAASAR
jgi:succinoglycan biosynthesis transport protein ExoP